ncbi:hypothetical protein YB2330_006544 [Saitoella coloradoensis]
MILNAYRGIAHLGAPTTRPALRHFPTLAGTSWLPTETTNEGLMGVGLSAGEASVALGLFEYPTVVDNLHSQGFIDSRFLSLYLNDIDAGVGEVVFGGVDNDKFEGSLSGPFPMLVNPDSGRVERYEIMLTDLSLMVNGSTSDVANGSLPVAVLLDSGSQVSNLPSGIVDTVGTALGLNSSDLAGDGNTTYMFPCSRFSEDSGDDTSDNILAFSFDNGTSYVNVPLHELIVPVTAPDGGILTNPDTGELYCQLGISYTGDASYDNPSILGDTFMRSAYIAYDIDNFNIYVGQTVFNSTTSNITVFPA